MLQFASYNDIKLHTYPFLKSSEKLDEKSLYVKLSALLCNPLMRLLSVLPRFTQTKDSYQIQ